VAIRHAAPRAHRRLGRPWWQHREEDGGREKLLVSTGEGGRATTSAATSRAWSVRCDQIGGPHGT